jgi:ABC-type polysaccharide/polyol phosphate export permease
MTELETICESERVRVFVPGRSLGFLGRLHELKQYRPFVLDQTRRKIQIRYNRSLLGWAWSLIHPLAILLIYTLVFGTILAGERNIVSNPDGLESFGHFLFSALVIWFVFQQVSTTVIGAFAESLMLRKRLYFPPTAPILAGVIAGLVGNGVEILVLVAAFLVVGSISFTFLGLFLVVPITAVFAFGIGLALAPLNARFRDVGHLYQVVLRLAFFTTPIIYTADVVPKTYAGLPLRQLLRLNPITWMTEASRSLTFSQQWPKGEAWLVMSFSATLSLVIGWYVFHRLVDDVVEGF